MKAASSYPVSATVALPHTHNKHKTVRACTEYKKKAAGAIVTIKSVLENMTSVTDDFTEMTKISLSHAAV